MDSATYPKAVPTGQQVESHGIRCVKGHVMYFESDQPQLRVGTDWVEVTIRSDVMVRFVARAYVPCLIVTRGKLDHLLYVGAMSLAQPLEEARKRNGGSLIGICLRLRKAREDRTAPYEIEWVT